MKVIVNLLESDDHVNNDKACLNSLIGNREMGVTFLFLTRKHLDTVGLFGVSFLYPVTWGILTFAHWPYTNLTMEQRTDRLLIVVNSGIK